MLNAQCSMLNAQCSMLNAQCSMLNAQCSMLNAQCSMLNAQILQQTLENQCPDIHKKRLKSLILATRTVLDGSDLTLTKTG
ncbi:hypothetical protein [Vibrio ostreicida]|uniref:hypothetical protein n=1 Tax=Vibrio ostreicida TaxID=526588 RepID=UPI0020CA42DB|nr:hypothetical protein [Vibrio ostreicida]